MDIVLWYNIALTGGVEEALTVRAFANDASNLTLLSGTGFSLCHCRMPAT
jgi:hypothetical protein